MTGIGSRSSFYLLGYVLVLWVLVLIVYGLYPGAVGSYPGMILHRQTHLSILEFFANKYVGYPTGVFMAERLPLGLVGLLLEKLCGFNGYYSTIATQILFLVLAGCGIYLLLRFFDCVAFVAITLSFLFLISPICLGHHRGYQYLSFAILLLPTFLLLDLKAFQCHTFSKVLLWLMLMIVGKVSLVFMNGYVFIFQNVMAGVFLLYYMVLSIKAPQRQALLVGLFVAANLVAFGIYASYMNAYMPSGVGYHIAPLGFFRAMSADAATILFPHASTFWNHILGVQITSKGLAGVGDGSNHSFNFLGYSYWLPALVLIFSKVRKPTFVWPMVIIACLGILLALGPSLKFNSFDSDLQSKSKLSYRNYILEAEDAIIELPTKVLYTSVPGFKNMRATYRWMAIPNIVLIVLMGVLYSVLWHRGKVMLVSCLLLINFVERVPNFGAIITRNKVGYDQSLAYDREVLGPLEHYLRDYERVLFLSNENDFLVNNIARSYPVYIYNIGGDKAKEVAREGYPERISRILSSTGDVTKVVLRAMKAGELDKLILPFFSLRSHYYSWPPTPNDRKKRRDSVLSRINIYDERFKYRESEWFAVLELADSSR